MATETATPPETAPAPPAPCGWYHPPHGYKAHYMIGGRSLCKQWRCEPGVMLFDDDSTTRNCCARCERGKKWLEEARRANAN